MTLGNTFRLALVLASPLALAACAHHKNTGATVPPARAALADPSLEFWKQPSPDVFRVRFESSKGPFVIEARRDWAPHGVDRFYNLVRAGYYDDSRFFRVDARYIAQFGIAGNPAISQIWRSQTIPDDPPKQSNRRGTIGFASPTNSNSCTTQLYINLGDNSRNDPVNFAIIGSVVEGMDVVDALYSGYGERSGGGIRAGRQDRLFGEGNAWLDRDFPLLDKLIRASVSLTIEKP
jgi:peptidyl-prolyl cis-trans isomerase A (cyclophilin A)